MAEHIQAFCRRRLRTREDVDYFVVLCLTVSVFLSVYTAVAACAAIAVATMMSYERRRRALASPYARLLLGFLLVPFFVSAMYDNILGLLASFALYAVVICGLYVRSVMTRRLFARVLDLCCQCSVGCFALALVQKLAAYPSAPDYRPVSTFTNANYYGAVVEIMLLICLYRCVTNRSARKWYLAAACLNLGGLYLTGSMSSAAAACVGILVFLALQHRRRLAFLFCVGAAGVLVLITCFPFLFPRVESVDVAWDQRFSIWETALRAIADHPLFGQGAVAYHKAAIQYSGYLTYHSHNLLIDLVLNFGLAGLLVIGYYAFQQGKLLLLRFRNRIGNASNVLMVAALSSMLVHGVTDVTIFWPQTGMLMFFILSSLSVGAEFLEREIEPRSLTVPAAFRLRP
ncbi:MAG TPA: O-antigen ligase family protein [Candidatus Caccousia avicola]|uniref:O-antigen ligase family protein n=1 Tax=Candidatus Caccousia avicola TaxID=2840721 RepID=A0A9D1DDS7_9FIRM|nr:O-antigen ligase family protein [Candidatus Caccousia avicola]